MDQLEELTKRVATLEGLVLQLMGQPLPEEEPPPVAEEPPPENLLLDTLDELVRESPNSLHRSIAQAQDEIRRLLDHPEEHARLATVVIPELIEVCEAARRTHDPDLPFFSALDARLTRLALSVGLEEIMPGPGSPYLPAEQNALKVVRSSDPAQRDRVDRCVSRGFRYAGKLLKKAEVIVFL